MMMVALQNLQVTLLHSDSYEFFINGIKTLFVTAYPHQSNGFYGSDNSRVNSIMQTNNWYSVSNDILFLAD